MNYNGSRNNDKSIAFSYIFSPTTLLRLGTLVAILCFLFLGLRFFIIVGSIILCGFSALRFVHCFTVFLFLFSFLLGKEDFHLFLVTLHILSCEILVVGDLVFLEFLPPLPDDLGQVFKANLSVGSLFAFFLAGLFVDFDVLLGFFFLGSIIALFSLGRDGLKNTLAFLLKENVVGRKRTFWLVLVLLSHCLFLFLLRVHLAQKTGGSG
mmetsp:Transcript_21363/g.25774  ORF Transcript_21363/g.25774 Transcript_21363/m.25774 type:complete len:209 (-) Transcript_21363:280-906(-)